MMLEDDDTDYDRIFANPCCQELKCSTTIPKKLAVKHRHNFDKLEKKEQDLIILAHFQAHRDTPELNNISCSRRKNHYYFANLRICKSMFLFLHNVGKDRFENLIKHYDSNGILPRIHKLANIAPPHVKNPAIEEKDAEIVVQFLESFGTQFGLPLPGKVTNRKKYNAIELPANETKASLYRKYCNSVCLVPNMRVMSQSTFRRVWQKRCPHIRLMKPRAISARKYTATDNEILIASPEYV